LLEDKVKVNFSSYLTKHHAMETYSGSAGIALRILNLGIGCFSDCFGG